MRYAIAIAHHRMTKRASNREMTDRRSLRSAINLVESHTAVECRSSTAVRYVGDSSVLSGKRHTLSSLVPELHPNPKGQNREHDGPSVAEASPSARSRRLCWH